MINFADSGAREREKKNDTCDEANTLEDKKLFVVMISLYACNKKHFCDELISVKVKRLKKKKKKRKRIKRK